MKKVHTPLAEDNLGLVHLCANRFRNRGIEYDDLYSAGCIGLVKASKAFDESRGVKFSTYAVPVILGEIKRLFRDGGAVKVSRSTKELSLKTTRYREKFLSEKGREPTISELCEHFCADTEEIVEALNVAIPPVSLTQEDDDENSIQTDIPVESPDEEIAERLSLRQAISSLESFDRQLVYLRYFENKTQSETAKELNMTQVQVSRREKKILEKIREQLECKI